MRTARHPDYRLVPAVAGGLASAVPHNKTPRVIGCGHSSARSSTTNSGRYGRVISSAIRGSRAEWAESDTNTGGRVVVLGAGAIGGITAASLANSGVRVTIVDPWSRHVETIVGDGLRVTTPEGDVRIEVEAVHIDRLGELAPIGVLLLALKAYDTEWAVRYATPYLDENGCIVSLQNGINEPRIAAVAGAARTVGCVVHLAGALVAPGHVVATNRPGWPAFTIGDLEGRNGERHTALAAFLGSVGPTALSDDIWSVLWAKLTLNVMSNALSGLTGFTTHRLWSDPDCLDLMIHLAGELVAVADAIGQKILPVKPAGSEGSIAADLLKAAHYGDASAAFEVRAVMGAIAARRVGSSENQPSLLQDVLKRRRTEVDHLNGYIADQGRRVGVPTPTNTAVVQAIRELEYLGSDPTPANLNRLIRAVR